MPTLAEVENQAMQLSHSERTALLARLLRNSPGVLHDQDEGVAEALRRDAGLESGTVKGLSLEEVRRSLDR